MWRYLMHLWLMQYINFGRSDQVQSAPFSKADVERNLLSWTCMLAKSSDTFFAGEKNIPANGVFLFILLFLCIWHINYLSRVFSMAMWNSIYKGHKCFVGWTSSIIFGWLSYQLCEISMTLVPETCQCMPSEFPHHGKCFSLKKQYDILRN